MDENKYYKSKIVELFGNKYEVKNKYSSSINNKNLLFIGYLKYNIKNMRLWIVNIVNKTIGVEFVEVCLFLFFILFCVYLLVLCLISLFEIQQMNEKKNFCINMCTDSHCPKECITYSNMCRDSPQNKSDCFENNIKYWYKFKELFLISSWYISTYIQYSVFLILAIGIIGNILFSVAYRIYRFYEIICDKINQIIPEFEKV